MSILYEASIPRFYRRILHRQHRSGYAGYSESPRKSFLHTVLRESGLYGAGGARSRLLLRSLQRGMPARPLRTIRAIRRRSRSVPIRLEAKAHFGHTANPALQDGNTHTIAGVKSIVDKGLYMDISEINKLRNECLQNCPASS